MIKQLTLATVLIVITSSAFADMVFNTKNKAETYCPLIEYIQFQAHSKVPHSAGSMSGVNANGTLFRSPQNMLEPRNMDGMGDILDAKLRQVAGSYGYISGQQIHCFYSYQGFIGVRVALIMQGKE